MRTFSLLFSTMLIVRSSGRSRTPERVANSTSAQGGGDSLLMFHEALSTIREQQMQNCFHRK